MYKRIEPGIKQYEGGTYIVYMSLPKREGRKEAGYSFHVGTVNTLEEAREIRDKSLKITGTYDKEKALEELLKLKKSISDKRMTRKKALVVLNNLLKDYDKKKDESKIKERNALDLAIRCLEREVSRG